MLLSENEHIITGEMFFSRQVCVVLVRLLRTSWSALASSIIRFGPDRAESEKPETSDRMELSSLYTDRTTAIHLTNAKRLTKFCAV